MKKKLCALALIAVLLAACAPAQNLALLFDTNPQPPTLGSWEGNVFTSEYLGLRVEMLDGWVALTDEELSELSGFDFTLLENRQDFWELVDTQGWRISDMQIWNPETFAIVEILHERFYTVADRMMSASQFNELEADWWYDELRDVGARYITIDISDTPVRIGSHYWYYFDDASLLEDGFILYGRHFQSVQHGFGMIIYVSYCCCTPETLEEIMAMFSPL